MRSETIQDQDIKRSNLDLCTRSLPGRTLATRTLAILLVTKPIFLTMLQVSRNSMRLGIWALANLYYNIMY